MNIVVIKENKPVGQVAFNGDRASIGRKSDCDISIKDPAVSGHHATVAKIKDKYVISDEGSTNGIYVKGRRVKEHILHHEDVVTIGEHQLRFLIVDTGGVAPSVKPETDARTITGVVKKTPLGTADGPMGFLTVTGGKRDGERITLEEGLTKIGEPGVQVAAVSRRPQGYFLIHVDGGKDRERVPIVNGEKIGFKSRKLDAGDEVEVAGVKMTYGELP